MKREIKITAKALKGFINFLKEQEKSESTIQSYKRELFSLQIYLDDSYITKERLIGYKSMISNQYTPSSCKRLFLVKVKTGWYLSLVPCQPC